MEPSNTDKVVMSIQLIIHVIIVVVIIGTLILVFSGGG